MRDDVTAIPEIADDVSMRMGSTACTVIARPDTMGAILREQRRRSFGTQVDALLLRSQKNEWIEAAFAAWTLAAACCPERELVLLPGKNYQFDDDTELFEARLANGCLVRSSDVRCYYFVRAQIQWATANFTPMQLNEAAKLPAALTPVYVHGNGDMTITLPKALDGEAVLEYGHSRVRAQLHAAGEHLFARLPVWTALGKPQPGDALGLSFAKELQAA